MQKALLVMCIDDDVDDTNIFSSCIQRIDPSIKSVIANDGASALKFLDKGDRPDFIFLDVNMPRMNGKDVLASIKSNYRFKNIPVIMYSGSISPNDKDEMLDLGAGGVMQKHANIHELEEALKKVLRIPEKS